MSKFHTLSVKHINRLTPEAVSIILDVPDTLKSNFTYKQGQYITLKKKLNGEEVRRSYSFCSSPVVSKDIEVAVKEVPDGAFSPYLNHKLAEGDTLEVMEPAGKFYTELDENQQKTYVGFAGGSGITPFMSIIQTTLLVEAESKFILFYGSQTSDVIIFKERLANWEEKFGDRLKVVHILSEEETQDPLDHGLMTPDKYRALIKRYTVTEKADEYFICGPLPMIENGIEVLKDMGITEEHIHYELFSVEAEDEKDTSDLQADDDTIPTEIEIILDEETFHIQRHKPWETLLDVALANNIDAPYSCRGGICATCMAKLETGEVRMKNNQVLSDKELNAGFVLTCQSIPLTKEIKVNYDDR